MADVNELTIAICGCGAIGSNLAVGLARRGIQNFLLIDNDRVESHNISTQAWFERDIGKMKATMLSHLLYSISGAWAVPYEKTIVQRGQLEKLFDDYFVALAVDAFDNRTARELVVGSHASVLHVGLSAEETADVVWDEKYTLPIDVELEDPCAYPLARSLIEVTVGHAASVIVDFLLTGSKRGMYIDNCWVV